MKPSQKTFAGEVGEVTRTAHFTLYPKEATKLLIYDITVLQRKLPYGSSAYLVYEINKIANTSKSTPKQLHLSNTCIRYKIYSKTKRLVKEGYRLIILQRNTFFTFICLIIFDSYFHKYMLLLLY